jgi:hypothetical protein
MNARQALHDSGAVLLFADERVLSSDDAWETWARETVEAESYSRRLGRRIREGYAEKVREWTDQGGGLVTVGFRRSGDHKLIEPDPGSMTIARRIWQLAADGLPDRAVAATVGASLWTVRGVLRSPLYEGRLRDGRPTRFATPIDPALIERARVSRQIRTRVGNRVRRNRTYPLSGNGPLVCEACGFSVTGDTRRRRNGDRIRVYRHRDGNACAGWPVRETPSAVLEEQVARLLDRAAPNRESAARIRAALARPVISVDELGLARLDRRLRALASELTAADQSRTGPEILAEIEAVRAERARIVALPIERDRVDPEDALEWLASLGTLWRATSDDGRRRLAVTVFVRLGVRSGRERGSHRIVTVETTREADRRGLTLALPASLEVTMVGDTGFEPVTSRM